MEKLQTLEELRTRKEVKDYFKQLGKEITEEELNALKQSYDQAQKSNGALTLGQLDNVAGGLTVAFRFSSHFTSKPNEKITADYFRVGKDGSISLVFNDSDGTYYIFSDGSKSDDLVLTCNLHSKAWRNGEEVNRENMHEIEAFLEKLTPDTNWRDVLKFYKKQEGAELLYISRNFKYFRDISGSNDITNFLELIKFGDALYLNRPLSEEKLDSISTNPYKYVPSDDLHTESLYRTLLSNCYHLAYSHGGGYILPDDLYKPN